MAWLLARSSAEPDRDYPTVGALARGIVAWRAGLPLGADGRPPEIELAALTAWRCDLPGGAAIAIRARAAGGRIVERLGYVFAPREAGERRESALTHLMAAILAAEPRETSVAA